MFKKILLCLMMVSPAAHAADIQWGPVIAGDNVSLLRVPGKVIPKEGGLSIESARVQGRVTNILKREGEVIRTGDALFSISSAECVSLEEEKRVSEERGLDELVRGTKAREEQLGLRVRRGQCDVLATHGGTIVKRQAEVGAAFNIGDVLATVLDVRSMNVELDLPERDLTFVKPNQKVRIKMPAFPNRTFEARVERILPSIDPLTRTSKVRLAGLHLPEGATMDALVLAEISVSGSEKILKVPTTALVFSRNKQYVMKNVDKPVPVPVEVISESENVSSVRPWNGDELHANDQIAVKGAIFVFNAAEGNDDKVQ